MDKKLQQGKSNLKIPRCTICKKEIENVSEQYAQNEHKTYFQCPKCERVWMYDDRNKKAARYHHIKTRKEKEASK